MSTWPHEDVAALNAFQGDPRGANGKVDPKWFAENVALGFRPIRCFLRRTARADAASRIPQEGGRNLRRRLPRRAQDARPAYIVEKRLNITGGTFCYRTERGGSRLSVHSWACAIDMDPQHNPFPRRWSGPPQIDAKLPRSKKPAFSGARRAQHDDDPMHFQLCDHY